MSWQEPEFNLPNPVNITDLYYLVFFVMLWKLYAEWKSHGGHSLNIVFHHDMLEETILFAMEVSKLYKDDSAKIKYLVNKVFPPL